MTGHQQLPLQRETEGGQVAGGLSPVGEGSPAVTRTSVVDTSVLLSDPRAMMRFAEHDVVLPVVVISELEAKRHHPELGYFARSALRILDDLRIRHGQLEQPVPTEGGGWLHGELNHTDSSSLPVGFRLGDNDTRILSVARNLADEGQDVCVVSRDLPMRVKVSACGLEAQEYRNEMAVDSGWTGMTSLDIAPQEMDALYDEGRVVVDDAPGLPCHTGVVLGSPSSSGLARASREVVEEVVERGLIEVLPLTHIRGRSLHDAFVIVDEAQSLERNVLLTVLPRIGQNSRVVLTHDVAQRDIVRVGRHDGVAAVIETLKGRPLFAHVPLTRSERSPIAALVTELLEP